MTDYTFLCAATYVSGMEITELAIMKRLKASGATVRCVINGWRDGDFARRLEQADIPYVLAHTGNLSLRVNAKTLRFTASTLLHMPEAREDVAAELSAHPPEIIVACNRDPTLLLGRVLQGHPVLFHMHDAPPATAKSRYQLRALAARVTAFAAVSHFVRDRLLELGVAPERVFVVHNGVAEPAPAEPARAEPARSPAVPTIGIAGQVAHWKGHDDLMEALILLANRGVAFRCHVVGRGDRPYVALQKALLEAVGIADRVVWRGFVADTDEIYEDLDIVVVPSRFEEPFGLTASEAGIRGIPVVVTDRGGLPEQVVDGETGFVVESEQPEQLVERLGELLQSADLRERLGEAARARVAEHFTEARMVDAFEAACAATRDLHSQTHALSS